MLGLTTTTRAQEYGFDVWTTANGLPQNTVTGVAQTPDGYLWLSTFDGLARFDGVRFTIFDKGNTKGIINNRFARLFADREGVVYAFTENHVVTVYRNGVFRSYSDFATSGEAIAAIVSDTKGNVIFETVKGDYALQGDRFVLTPGQKEPNSNKNYRQIYWGKSGAKWVVERNQTTRHKDGQVTTYPLKLTREELGAGNSLAPYEDQHGALWVRRSPAFELWRLQDGKVAVFTKKELPALNELYPNQVKEDADGSLWFLFSGRNVPKPSQFVRFKDGQFTSYQLNEAVGATASLTDREGNFWLATTTGLRRLRRKLIATISVKDGLNSNEIYPLLQTHNGDIFIGSAQGVNRYSQGKVTDLGLNYRPDFPLTTRGLWEDDQARLWLGFQGSGGFGRFEAPSSVKRVGKYDLPNGATDFTSDRAGYIWIATGEGLYKYKDDKEIAHYTVKDGLPSDNVITIHVDRNGNLWAGTFDGLAQFKDGRFISYNTEADSPKGFVRAIYEDADGVLWCGTYGDGLVRYKGGKFFNYRVEHGLFNNGVFAILEDKRGNFWMSSNRGIHRVSRQELNDFAEGRIPKLNSVSYDEKDGMLNAECNGGRLPAAIKAKDGKFWFPTMGGVVIIDPEAEAVNPQPPPVVIETFLIDHKPIDPQILRSSLIPHPSPVELNPQQSQLEINYTALSLLKSAQIKFKYKLEGLESNWTEAGTQRTANYSYLPAGSYTFHVIAANANGVWNNKGASIRVVVRPYFYRTWWFLWLAVAALTGAIWLIAHARLSQVRKIAEAKTAFSRQLITSQEAERKRIAAELHDGLGQSLLVIKNRTSIGKRVAQDSDKVTAQLDEISNATGQALEEVRGIAYNLRPYHLERLGLRESLNAMIEKIREATGLEINSRVALFDAVFSKDEEVLFYRVIQECLNNIIKHAQATTVEINIVQTETEVTAHIRDNGCGFAANAAHPSSGFGLIGMAERVRMLGGTHSVESAVGKGTAVTVIIPLGEEKDEH
ncbi:MAG: two-component regulator propeller domain-containing protein [Acidobacteriota bacterium]